MPKKLKVFSKKKSKKEKLPSSSSSSSDNDDKKPTPPPVEESPQIDSRSNAFATTQRMSPTPLDYNRRVADVPPPRSRSTGPHSRVEITQKSQMDLMECVTKSKSKKVRLVTDPSMEASTSTGRRATKPRRQDTYAEKYARFAERYSQGEAERPSQRPTARATSTRRTQSAAPSFSFRSLVPDLTSASIDAIPGTSGIVNVAKSVKRAINNLSMSPVETEHSESSGSEYRRTWLNKLSKRKQAKKANRSRSLDTSLLQGIKKKLSFASPKRATSAFTSPVRWLPSGHKKKTAKKKQSPQEFLKSTLNIDIGSSKVLKSMKDTFSKPKSSSGTKKKSKDKKPRSKDKAKYVLTVQSGTDSSEIDTDETEC